MHGVAFHRLIIVEDLPSHPAGQLVNGSSDTVMVSGQWASFMCTLPCPREMYTCLNKSVDINGMLHSACSLLLIFMGFFHSD